MKRLLLLALCALFAADAGARTLYVNASRPNNNGSGFSRAKAKKTLQAAINVAKKGDTILVLPGAYAPIKTNNKKITIKSTKGRKKTKIVKTTEYDNIPLARLGKDYSYPTSPGFTKMKGVTTKLSGFLLDGNGKYSGGDSIVGGTLSSCTIRKFCRNMRASNVKFVGCTIRDNSGAIISNSTLDRCKLVGNNCINDRLSDGSSMGLVYHCTLSNCLLSKNTGSAASGHTFVNESDLFNCTAADNLLLSYKDASGNWLGTAGDNPCFSRASWYNCIVRNNKWRVDVVRREWVDDYDAGGNLLGRHWVNEATTEGVANLLKKPTVSFCTNTDATNKNPKFVNPAKGNYKLKKGSYAIDKGSLPKWIKKYVGAKDLAGRKRIRGKAIDRGCYEY